MVEEDDYFYDAMDNMQQMGLEYLFVHNCCACIFVHTKSSSVVLIVIVGVGVSIRPKIFSTLDGRYTKPILYFKKTTRPQGRISMLTIPFPMRFGT
nr:hypothetical protein CFP56_49047 [Quercus suber]